MTIALTLTKRRRLAIPADWPLIYAIGDIHGCHEALLDLEERIRTDSAGHKGKRPVIVYLGDYVDRGPASNAVLDHLSRTDHDDGMKRIALCGNHDETFLGFLFNPEGHMRWLDYGGDTTIESYGIDLSQYIYRDRGMESLGAALRARVPKQHVAFLRNLPIALLSGDRLFVHAGIKPGIALAEQTDEDMMWIREPFLNKGPRLPITVIHGHTANEEPVFGKSRICIDTTCFATGRLTALKVTPDAMAVL